MKISTEKSLKALMLFSLVPGVKSIAIGAASSPGSVVGGGSIAQRLDSDTCNWSSIGGSEGRLFRGLINTLLLRPLEGCEILR